jgi:GGDEF domain-containing protein
MSAPSPRPSDSPRIAARHVLWVAEAALGRLRKTVPSGGLVDDGDGFVFLLESPRELDEIVSELTSGAAFGVAPVAGGLGRDLIEAVSDARREGRQKLRGGPDRTPRMAAIATPVMFVPGSINGEDARRKFLDDDTLTSLVYADDRQRPVAALGREKLFRMFSGQYGHAVFANRPVFDAADPNPRTIDADTTIVEAAITVANRDSDSLYDDVLVVDPGGRVVGIVRVRDLLRALTSIGLDRIQQLNPLTGMPGSARTEQALAEIIDTGETLVVSRVDIADFKTYNERSGFSTGDRTIQALGHAVASVGRSRGVRCTGHLGGDDFIVAWNDEDEAIAGAIEIAVELTVGMLPIGPLPDGVGHPELAVSTLVAGPNELRDVATLAERLAALKDAVRRHGGRSTPWRGSKRSRRRPGVLSTPVTLPSPDGSPGSLAGSSEARSGHDCRPRAARP